jgi:hypothetical protein
LQILFRHHTTFLLITLLTCFNIKINASPAGNPADSNQISTRQQALDFLDSVQRLDSSKYWPNADPALFLENLKLFATTPFKFYEGRGTNFCSYFALTYIPLTYDPLGFSRFMIELYQKGRARMGKVMLKPGAAVRKEAGLLKYKGPLDISPAGQIWFLTLADHFKGYVNIINLRFQDGDENTLWASTNFAKFNRMLRKLFPLKVHAKGADLIRPWVNDLPAYLEKKLQDGPLFLYLNNRLLYKKTHVITRFGIPTHFVLLLNINRANKNKINITYWDYGKLTLQQVDEEFLRKIVFGITDYRIKKE